MYNSDEARVTVLPTADPFHKRFYWPNQTEVLNVAWFH